jgi:hypothetical protein
MIFLILQQETAAQLGLDNSVSSQNTLIERWINTSQQMIAQAYNWAFLRASAPLIVKTVPDYTTGTVTTIAASTTITFSGVIAESKTGQYLQTSSSNDWYKITAHTAGTATAAISPSAIYAGSALTYTVRKIHYSLDATVDRVLGIRQGITPFDLIESSAESFHFWDPEPTDTGTPKLYFMQGKDSSDIWQFGLWPIPDAVINLYVEYIQAVTDLSADSDVSIIPAKWHTSVLLKGAQWQGLNFLGDSRASTCRDEFFLGIEEMKRHNQPSTKNHRVMMPVDISMPTTAYRLPDNYPMYPGVG